MRADIVAEILNTGLPNPRNPNGTPLLDPPAQGLEGHFYGFSAAEQGLISDGSGSLPLASKRAK